MMALACVLAVVGLFELALRVVLIERYVFKLRITKRRKHGRPRGHKRSWVMRDIIVTKPTLADDLAAIHAAVAKAPPFEGDALAEMTKRPRA